MELFVSNNRIFIAPMPVFRYSPLRFRFPEWFVPQASLFGAMQHIFTQEKLLCPKPPKTIVASLAACRK
jgi:hypothetical protein